MDNLSTLNAKGQLVSVCFHLHVPVVSTKVMLDLCVLSCLCFYPEVLVCLAHCVGKVTGGRGKQL